MRNDNGEKWDFENFISLYTRFSKLGACEKDKNEKPNKNNQTVFKKQFQNLGFSKIFWTPIYYRIILKGL